MSVATCSSAVVVLHRCADDATTAERDMHRATWLNMRRGGIGASEIAAVLGLSPFASPFSLWWQKREGWQWDQTEAQEWGLRSEPMITQKFIENHPELAIIRPSALYAHRRRYFMLCSPDLLAVRKFAHGQRLRIEPVEIKTDEGGAGWGEPGTDQVPLHHRIQVQWQLAVFGAPRGWLIRYARKRYTEYRIPANTFNMRQWIVAAQNFLQSIEDDEPPEPDGHDSTTDALTRLYPTPEDKRPPAVVPNWLALEFEAAWHDEREAKARLKLAKNLIRDKLGDAKQGMTPGGRVFVERTVSPRSGYTVQPTTVDKLNRKKQDDDQP